jgi:regulator of protease activity HflC (stomatin/prohibitin superfamily)
MIFFFFLSSAKVIVQPNQAIVERLGKYDKTLRPGLTFIWPLIDKIVLERPMTEQVLDIKPQQVITRDSVSLTADAVVYWQIRDLKRCHYEIRNVENAIQTLIVTTVRSEIGRMTLDETFSSRKSINKALLQQLDEATDTWGVKVTRVEVQQITPAKTLLESMEMERAAEIRRRAAILDAKGTAEAMQVLAQALNLEPNSQEFLKFVIAQKYVEANQKLGSSQNSKVLFMDPNSLNRSLNQLLGDKTETEPEKSHEIKPEIKPDIKPDIKPEIKPETK